MRRLRASGFFDLFGAPFESGMPLYFSRVTKINHSTFGVYLLGARTHLVPIQKPYQ
jgi:hypothetical protein